MWHTVESLNGRARSYGLGQAYAPCPPGTPGRDPTYGTCPVREQPIAYDPCDPYLVRRKRIEWERAGRPLDDSFWSDFGGTACRDRLGMSAPVPTAAYTSVLTSAPQPSVPLLLTAPPPRHVPAQPPGAPPVATPAPQPAGGAPPPSWAVAREGYARRMGEDPSVLPGPASWGLAEWALGLGLIALVAAVVGEK